MSESGHPPIGSGHRRLHWDRHLIATFICQPFDIDHIGGHTGETAGTLMTARRAPPSESLKVWGPYQNSCERIDRHRLSVDIGAER